MFKRRIIILVSLVVILTPTCTINETNSGIYDDKNYRRITTDLDSANNMYVIYKSLLDSSRTMIKYYWDNGKLQAFNFFYNSKKDGHWIQYFDNGTLSFEGNFLNDLKVDTHKIYHPNGKIAILEIYNNGKKVGTWNYYNEAGALERSENYPTSK